MTPDAFAYVGLLIVGLFTVAMFACDAWERRIERRQRLVRQSGEYPVSHVRKEQS